MKNKLIHLCILPLAILLLGWGILNIKPVDLSYYSTEGLEMAFNVNYEENYNDENEEYHFYPYIGKSFVGFREAVAYRESRGNYFIVNDYGYMGKYQFGKSTLKALGIYDTEEFINDPELQELAFDVYTARNKWVLHKDIKRYSGKYINGIYITESGILAAAHLAGPANVKKYLQSKGAEGFSDAFGTSIANYLRKFSGYDTSHIVPDKNAKVIYKG